MKLDLTDLPEGTYTLPVAPFDWFGGNNAKCGHVLVNQLEDNLQSCGYCGAVRRVVAGYGSGE